MTTSRFRCAIATSLPVAIAACHPSPEPPAAPAPEPDTAGVDLAGIDRAIAPGDDFFGYANGAWVKRTEIPADRSSYGTGAVLTELTARRTADLIKEAALHAPAGSDAQKIGDTYASFMDEDGIEAKGIAPLQPALDRIAAIADAGGLGRALGETLRTDVDVLNNTNDDTDNLFGLWVAQDLDDPSRYAPFLLQGGLVLPDRDYYLDPSKRMIEIRDHYRAHIATMLTLAGIGDADAKATGILA